MKINVASLNPQKIAAVRELVPQYPLLAGATVEGVLVQSGVGEQPKSLEETVMGAINRAKSVFKGVEYSFGLESGVVAVPYTKTGVMDLCVCAIYDGADIYLGMSSAFEPPPVIVRVMREKGIDMSAAVLEVGLTQSKKIGAEEGIVGLLTRGRLNRLAQIKQAVVTALIHLENAHLFKMK